jgi:tetratricopeptide (TPR) repeat protein
LTAALQIYSIPEVLFPMKRTFLFTVILLAVSAGIALAGMEITSARVYVKQHEWLKALQFYNQGLQKEPNNLEAYEERGELYHTLASDSSLKNIARQVVPNSPDPQAALYDSMLADFRNATVVNVPGDEGTVKKLKKKIDGILGRTWEHFYFEALQSDSSYLKAKDAKVTDPDPKSYLHEALHNLDMAIKVEPNKWNAYGFKAQLLTILDSTAASADNWALAISKIESLDKSGREVPETKEGLAIAREALLIDQYNLGRYQDMLKTADKVMETDSTNINAIQLKANVLAKMASDTSRSATQRDSLKEVAVSALRSAARATTDSTMLTDIEYTIGQFRLQVADTAGAMSAFDEALKYNPNDKDVLFVMGVLYLEGGSHANTEKARDTFKKITEIDPNSGPAWINYGIALSRLNDTKNGAEAIKKGKELGGK